MPHVDKILFMASISLALIESYPPTIVLKISFFLNADIIPSGYIANYNASALSLS